MTQIKAPWTEEQIEALNRWQERDDVHPFTCPGEGIGCGDDRILTAMTAGWVCSCGRYTQDWAHDFMMVNHG